MDFTSFSYYHITLEGESTSDLQVFDMPSKVELYNLGLYADYTLRNIFNFISIRLGTYLYPLSYLKHDLTIYSYPNSVITNQVSSDSMQEFQYSLFTNILINTGSFADLSLGFYYEYSSVEMKTLDYDESINDFGLIDSYLGGDKYVVDMKILLNNYGVGGIKPMLGVSYASTENNTLDEKKTKTELNYLFGLEKKF